MSSGKYRPKEHNSRDYATNTSNPKYQDHRIFVGNIDTNNENISDDLFDRFSEFGEVTAISVHPTFAFIQFKLPSQASRAISKTNHTMFQGKKIDVHPSYNSDVYNRSNSKERDRDRSPISRMKESRSRDRDRSPLHRHDGKSRSPPRRGRDYYHNMGERNSRYEDDFGRSEQFREYLPREPKRPLLDSNKANDCEIIVIHKELRSYAESVERRVKNLSLSVDILFVKDEAALIPTIEDVARKGSLYGIVISNQNEAHRSVTLNIFHGTPQEHRNMPVDDAMKLVAFYYHEYTQNTLKNKIPPTPARKPEISPVMHSTPTPSADFHNSTNRNPKLQQLIVLLADGKYLTSAELQVIINYLQEQRDEVLARERGDHLKDNMLDMQTGPEQPFKFDNPMARQQQQSYEMRNDSMLRKFDSDRVDGMAWKDSANSRDYNNASSDPHKNSGSSQNQSRSGGNFLNFDNPTVQKALDNLIQSGPNLLQSVLGSNSQDSRSVSLAPEETKIHKPSLLGSDGSLNKQHMANQDYSCRAGPSDKYHQSKVPHLSYNQVDYHNHEPSRSERSFRHPLLGTPVSGKAPNQSGHSRSMQNNYF